MLLVYHQQSIKTDIDSYLVPVTGALVVVQTDRKFQKGKSRGVLLIYCEILYSTLFLPPVCAVAGLDELRLVDVGRGLFLNQAQ